ncbi:hypothetical protein X801_00619 [Opisthorchis viverrini]|uniref:Uncharacterized protein n=1 Tax=Opisthorchis viverrini TaxID=6198 RepID=A0A1S8X9T4_OPIVI|nr:hypothetical protein X801_00619 [Opisthorchis viverrini]
MCTDSEYCERKRSSKQTAESHTLRRVLWSKQAVQNSGDTDPQRAGVKNQKTIIIYREDIANFFPSHGQSIHQLPVLVQCLLNSYQILWVHAAKVNLGHTYVKAVIRKTKRTKSKVFSTRSRRSYLSKLVVAVLLWAVDFGSTSREGKTLSFRGEKATGCFFLDEHTVCSVAFLYERASPTRFRGSTSRMCTIGRKLRILIRKQHNPEQLKTAKRTGTLLSFLDLSICFEIITPDPWFRNCEIERYNYDHLTSTISPVLVKTNTTDMADKERHIPDTESKLFVLNEKLRKHHPGIRSSVDILRDEIPGDETKILTGRDGKVQFNTHVIMFHEVDDDFNLQLSNKTFDSSKGFLKRQVHNELPPKLLNKKHYSTTSPGTS